MCNIAMTTQLEGYEIPVENIIDEDYEFTFDASSHWMPVDALFGAKTVAQVLNDEYGWDFDISIYNNENYKNLLDDYPTFQENIKNTLGYDYYFPIPLYDNQFKIEYAEQPFSSGNFQEAFLKAPDEWDYSSGAYHDMFKLSNSLIYEIHNETVINNKGKRILVIGDSFNWPLSAYLSLGVEDLTIIHNASFTGSLETYIQKNNPDFVIMIYNDAEFYPVYTEDAYYLK